ncbi:hypothetical protein Tco_0891147 [Tanacetum coccineum]|uniref:Uncharacterized protein n=1 Tax=Tanacetum coccineum TaxID=301880 RepID=A0ABQ5C228_9ASTR
MITRLRAKIEAFIEYLVDGLSRIKYGQRSLSVPACEQGKRKNGHISPKVIRVNFQLNLLLYGFKWTMRVETLMGKQIYSGYFRKTTHRYTWVYFFRTKDEIQMMIIQVHFSVLTEHEGSSLIQAQSEMELSSKTKNEVSISVKLASWRQTLIARTPQRRVLLNTEIAILVEAGQNDVYFFIKFTEFLWVEAIVPLVESNFQLVKEYYKIPR